MYSDIIRCVCCRLKHFKNKDGSTRSYLQLVENIRVGNKTRQRVLVNLGRVDDLQNSGQIDRLIESLKNFSTKEWIRKEALNVNQTYLWGPVVIFEQLWKELGIERVLRRLCLLQNIKQETAGRYGCR